MTTTTNEPEDDAPSAEDLYGPAAEWGAVAHAFFEQPLTPAEAALADMTTRLQAWLAAPAQAPLAGIQGDAEELFLHAAEMRLDTDEGAAERALRGASKAQAEVWAGYLHRFVRLWEMVEAVAHGDA
jgi:hypothetical protein